LVPPVYANSSRGRCAIYLRDTAIRICSIPPLKSKNLFFKILSWDKVTSRAEYFDGQTTFDFCPNMAVS
jgi:hypothetical protein